MYGCYEEYIYAYPTLCMYKMHYKHLVHSVSHEPTCSNMASSSGTQKKKKKKKHFVVVKITFILI